MGETQNIWSDEWEFERDDEEWAADKASPLPRGEKIGATLYEVPPGKSGGDYHFHHGAEELLVVLRGRPTLREPGGERVLEGRDVVHFPVGPAGAHQLINRSDEPVRYLMVSNRPSPEAVEYPDTRQLSVMAFTESQLGRTPLGHPHAGRAANRVGRLQRPEAGSSVASVFFDERADTC